MCNAMIFVRQLARIRKGELKIVLNGVPRERLMPRRGLRWALDDDD